MSNAFFKGKRVDNGEWVFGGALNQTDCYGRKINKWYIIDGTSTKYEIGYPYQIERTTLCQYTGKMDNQGVALYKGDIFECEFDGKKCRYYVIWDACNLEWNTVLISEDKEETLPLCCHYFSTVRIIGNVFDNPELLS